MRATTSGCLCVLVGLALLGIARTCSAQSNADPRIALRSGAGGHHLEVIDLSAEQRQAYEALSADAQQRVLRAFVRSDIDDLPPLSGAVSLVAGNLRFVPRYALEPGLEYRAVLDLKLLGSKNSDRSSLTQVVSVEAKPRHPTTVVEQIYPSAEVLPENQLKFYLHFSAPMSRGEAYRHVRLLDADGREVEGAFLELGEELWDADQRRFTLLCDPGRVKRGLKPREELGPVLVEGARYTLVVDEGWRDATRTPLNGGARKEFAVAAPDDEPIDPEQWKITSPPAGSFDPLLVRFGEPLDHSLLQRVLRVMDAGGDRVSGTIATGDNEACWQFTPVGSWPAGPYQLVVDTTLEDLAGNSIGRPFEVDEFKPVQQRIESETITIPFRVE